MALNVLYTNKEKIYLVYVSEHNSKNDKQVISLTIQNGKGCLYVSSKNCQHY